MNEGSTAWMVVRQGIPTKILLENHMASGQTPMPTAFMRS